MSGSRTKKAAVNVFFGLSLELIKLACGLILPRLIITNYGSAYNGLVHSVSNFLSVISLMKMGIGGVTRAALFKPLAEKDEKEMSAVLSSTEQFMHKISIIFLFFTLCFACFYPFLIKDEFGWLFSASLVFIIAIATFAEYYFGFTYQMLLSADQKGYIYSFLSIITTVLNTVVSVVLINSNQTIHVVKLGSSLVNIITPMYLYYYCHKNYNIVKTDKNSIKQMPQRWDAFAHETASFVNDNLGVMALTMFSNLSEISVFSLYNYVIINLKKIVSSLVSGFDSAFGDMYAKKEFDLMKKNLRIYELINFSFVSIVYSTALATITKFVVLYTKGVSDVDYSRELFAWLLVFGGAFNCIRYTYKSVINCTGHYKKTKSIAIAEAIINIVVSIVMVINNGIIGVSVGMVITMAFGTIAYSKYLSDNIVDISIVNSYKHILVSLIIMFTVGTLSKVYIDNVDTFFSWVVYAFLTTMISIFLTIIVDFAFYKEDFITLLNKSKTLIKRKINE